MCGVFRGGRMPPRKIPPAPRTRCEASGAQAGCAFFAPGFFAQAKKGGSRRRGAKALDLDLRQQQVEQDTPTADPAAKRKARRGRSPDLRCCRGGGGRSEEHTSELQSLMRISYAVFCLKKKTNKQQKGIRD